MLQTLLSSNIQFHCGHDELKWKWTHSHKWRYCPNHAPFGPLFFFTKDSSAWFCLPHIRGNVFRNQIQSYPFLLHPIKVWGSLTISTVSVSLDTDIMDPLKFPIMLFRSSWKQSMTKTCWIMGAHPWHSFAGGCVSLFSDVVINTMSKSKWERKGFISSF